jgi:transposase
VIRQFDERRRVETLSTVPSTTTALQEVVDQARRQRPRGGQVVWIQESTSGWARVQALLAGQVCFELANVVQMPKMPKGHRHKTDRTDTARILREYRNGSLPRAHQPTAWWRQVRRLVALRENLINRRTALRNWINRYLAHETWEDRTGLWSEKGLRRLQQLAAKLPESDRLVLAVKLQELQQLELPLSQVEAEMHALHRGWPQAQQLDAVKGIGVIAAVAIAARIGPIERFRNAEALIAFAGLAPAVRQSDQTRREGRIGGGGTDGHLRHYLIEATVWARELPRYRPTYERVAKRRGKKIGRLVVARLLLRSIFKVLRDGVAFDAGAEPAADTTAP